MCTYVTYESLFAFTQTMLSLITVIACIITLVITIVKLHSSKKDTKNKRKK